MLLAKENVCLDYKQSSAYDVVPTFLKTKYILGVFTAKGKNWVRDGNYHRKGDDY